MSPITERKRKRGPKFMELLPLDLGETKIIQGFVAEVERRAEANMLKTGKLEGAHYAAMKQVMKEAGI